MTNNQPTLESERLILRPFELTDASRVQELAGDERIADTTAEIPHPYPDGLAEQWISGHLELWANKKGANYAILLKESGEVIGSIAIKNISEQEGEIGYWIGTDYWNKGYCTEALRLIVDFGFQNLNLKRLYGEHMTRNPASGKVFENAGFTHFDSSENTCGYRKNTEAIDRYELLNG